ncbi:hypothetical protein TEA_022588 [Camellia sinensis var. sinensis]|uniref:Haem-binding uptake Tiki superfamily ChaN domain-containing protein n=1 Tax=Camellia sinensis var. sinensis TaxID=542762 RepID=A0A4S4D7E4_CAMSN|nr:hypothetical protein TEA_022588 [Camellia sinensis var. sinensis]
MTRSQLRAAREAAATVTEAHVLLTRIESPRLIHLAEVAINLVIATTTTTIAGTSDLIASMTFEQLTDHYPTRFFEVPANLGRSQDFFAGMDSTVVPDLNVRDYHMYDLLNCWVSVEAVLILVRIQALHPNTFTVFDVLGSMLQTTLLDSFSGFVNDLAAKIDGETLKSIASHWPPQRWQEYEPLFTYCRDNGVRIVACGTLLEVSRTVQAEGIRGLSKADCKIYAPPAGSGFILGFTSISCRSSADINFPNL